MTTTQGIEGENDLSPAVSSPEHSTACAEGRAIHLREWGDRRNETVILIHGIAAHGGWWESVAPFLAASRHVVALDLSGHGDSDRRPVYGADSWAEDVAPLIDPLHPPLIVGHSLGGMVALRIARDRGSSLRGAVVVDAPLRMRSEQRRGILRSRAVSAGTVMSSEAEALARFRPMPDEGGLDPALVRRVAAQSLSHRSDGVRWKVDPGVFLAEPVALEELVPPACPVALIRGEFGMLTEASAIRAMTLMPDGVGHSTIPGAGHHPMLSHPRALADELGRVMDAWPAPAERPRPSHPEGAS